MIYDTCMYIAFAMRNQTAYINIFELNINRKVAYLPAQKKRHLGGVILRAPFASDLNKGYQGSTQFLGLKE